MRPRDLLILCGAVGLSASVGLVIMSSDTLAVELPPEAIVATAKPLAAPGPSAAAPVNDDSAPVTALVGTEERRVDTTHWTKGIVRGDVQIAVSILDQIQSIAVVVEELRNPIEGATFRHPYKAIVPVKLGIGTPTFEILDIPFSDHPYSISLHSPGLNGSRRTYTIDASSPLHEDLVLSITPGAPFSVLLRDQDQTPYPRVDVRMVPSGEPAGRPTPQGITDSFGSVVFESVLAGDYQVVAAQSGIPLAEPQLITVQPGGRMFGPKVQGQSYVMTVERGMPLEAFVSCGGYRIADATVQLQASDRVKLTQFRLNTDFNGRAEFPHLTPGVWLIDVFKDDFQRTTRQITIKDGETPAPLQINLVRLR